MSGYKIIRYKQLIMPDPSTIPGYPSHLSFYSVTVLSLKSAPENTKNGLIKGDHLMQTVWPSLCSDNLIWAV